MDVVAELRALIGVDGVLDAEEVARRSAGALRPDHLKARALARPKTTQDVAAVVKFCAAHNLAIVPQGGLTGLVHAADASPDEIILSLERMREIENIDPVQRTATVQAGVVLQSLQDAALEHDLSFPLDLGARGSCTIGGNAATNAGGNRVIRYGMMRDMILGLEVVLADGSIVSSMNTFIKNNAGYDLKQMFIGSEGTLGVITRLVLRLREKPLSVQTAFVGAPDFPSLAALLKHMDRALGGALSAFEVMWAPFYQLVTTPPAKGRAPLERQCRFYALIESQGGDPQADDERMQAALASALEAGLIEDAAIARSQADALAFWGLRDDVAQLVNGGYPIIFDVSLPIAEMERYAGDLGPALTQAIGPHKLWIFGHLGDGNLHVAVQVAFKDYVALRPKVEAVVYGGLKPFNGSVSAEHGVGLEKKPYLSITRNDAELALMRRWKAALDPTGVLNPGKVI